MGTNKEIFKRFCESNKNVPLFISFNWYNSLFKNSEWDVVLEYKDDNVLGFLPFLISKKRTFNVIVPPYLTPYQGVWLNYPSHQKYANQLSFDKKVITSLINKLPKVDLFHQKFLPSYTNWLPFYWKGFEQTTRYTYIIEDLKDLPFVKSNFKENVRREIKKAEKSLYIVSSSDVELLYQMKGKAYENENNSYPIPIDLLRKAYQFCTENGCGEMLIAKDENDNIHSILFYVWDDNSAYYLQGVTDDRFKSTGSMSLLLWEAIRRSSKYTKAFNFEGSMIEPIERYFRAFGGRQVPYFEIKKTNSKFLKLIKY